MNSFHYTSESVNASNKVQCVNHIWVECNDNIEVFTFKTHKEAEKFVDYMGQNGYECGYFESFKLHTFKETKQYCKNQDFDDNNTLWDVLKNSLMSVFKNDD
jgi:hypothetical protein